LSISFALIWQLQLHLTASAGYDGNLHAIFSSL
jgi:hypothetical protein